MFIHKKKAVFPFHFDEKCVPSLLSTQIPASLALGPRVGNSRAANAIAALL